MFWLAGGEESARVGGLSGANPHARQQWGTAAGARYQQGGQSPSTGRDGGIGVVVGVLPTPECAQSGISASLCPGGLAAAPDWDCGAGAQAADCLVAVPADRGGASGRGAEGALRRGSRLQRAVPAACPLGVLEAVVAT